MFYYKPSKIVNELTAKICEFLNELYDQCYEL